jgi:hypothetical protein
MVVDAVSAGDHPRDQRGHRSDASRRRPWCTRIAIWSGRTCGSSSTRCRVRGTRGQQFLADRGLRDRSSTPRPPVRDVHSIDPAGKRVQTDVGRIRGRFLGRCTRRRPAPSRKRRACAKAATTSTPSRALSRYATSHHVEFRVSEDETVVLVDEPPRGNRWPSRLRRRAAGRR